MTQNIFIVDDDPFWTKILSKILKSLGYVNITTFNNGAEFLENISKEPHIVFLDYQMDEMNGLEVLKLIKQHNPKIGVIFCTAMQDLTVAVDAIKYGSCDYLLKENANQKEVLNILTQYAAT